MHKVSPVPLVAGTLLFCGATALLCEDAWQGHVQLNHLLQPVLMLGTITAGVLAHHRLSSLRLSGLAFLALAVLGSTAVVYATLSRTATTRDALASDAMAMNRTLGLKSEALDAAKASAKVECKSLGPKCVAWNTRVDQLTRDMALLRAVAVDPRADALARLAKLAGYDEERVRAVVSALDPVILPLFLEAGCILFFAAAFPRVRRASVPQVLRKRDASVTNQLNQREMAKQLGVHESTISRRLKALERVGQVQRQRDGRNMLLLPAPQRKDSK